MSKSIVRRQIHVCIDIHRYTSPQGTHEFQRNNKKQKEGTMLLFLYKMKNSILASLDFLLLSPSFLLPSLLPLQVRLPCWVGEMVLVSRQVEDVLVMFLWYRSCRVGVDFSDPLVHYKASTSINNAAANEQHIHERTTLPRTIVALFVRGCVV